MTRETALELVYIQIKEDVYMDDYTAIAELIKSVPLNALIDFISEENIGEPNE